MAMDPVTLALISGVAGAATQEMVKKSWNSGKKWLEEFFRNHQPQAQEKAKENTLDFLVELGNRLQELENRVDKDSDIKARIENALSDPDFSAVLYNAMISSARTSSKEKHKLLAHIVSDRLQADQESLGAIISGMAVDAIPHLSKKQLQLLGVMGVVIWNMEPSIHPKVPKEEYPDVWTEYLSKDLSLLIPDEEINSIDYFHLLSVSCIGRSTEQFNLKDHISPPKEWSIQWDADKFLNETDIGKKLNKLWVNGLDKVYLTSLGGVIGTYVHDEIMGKKTNIILQ